MASGTARHGADLRQHRERGRRIPSRAHVHRGRRWARAPRSSSAAGCSRRHGGNAARELLKVALVLTRAPRVDPSPRPRHRDAQPARAAQATGEGARSSRRDPARASRRRARARPARQGEALVADRARACAAAAASPLGRDVEVQHATRARLGCGRAERALDEAREELEHDEKNLRGRINKKQGALAATRSGQASCSRSARVRPLTPCAARVRRRTSSRDR